MANVPAWFKANDYFQNKLAAMGSGWDDLTLRAAFKDAGYTVDAAGLYQHFLDYGEAEGISPDALFNNDEYLYAKAVQYYKTPTVTLQQAQSMLYAMNQAGMSPWDHYDKYGGKEGINPSASFDTDRYYQDKLDQLKADDPAGNWDLPKLKAAFDKDGLTPLEHYYMYGQNEGLKVYPVGDGAPGANYSLTASADTLYGTTGDDYFIAKPGTLNDADYVDGGAGTDELYAYVDDLNVATTPTISNVEKVIFRAQHNTTPSGSNNPAMGVHVDATDITGMTLLGSDNSRADLSVEDVRTDSNKMTIRFSDSDPGDVDFNVFFNPQNLKAMDVSKSGTLQLQLMDVKNAQLNNQPLKEQPFNKFSFEYSPSSGVPETVSLVFRDADKALYTGPTATYATLLQAFKNAIADLPAKYAGVFTAKLAGNFFAETVVAGTHYADTGSILHIDSSDGAVSVSSAGSGWGVSSGTVPPVGGIVWNASTANTTDCPLIQTNVQLDNVARVQWNDATPDCLPSNDDYGSESGDLVIGSLATRGGVERFDVTVDRGSWLSSLSSTNNTLRMVTAVNADFNGDGINGNVKAQANNSSAQFGQLYIGDSLQPVGTPDLASWQDAPKLLATNGLTDVKLFEGSAFQGDINIGAQITAAAYDKYTKDVDGLRTVYDRYAPGGDFAYKLGAGNDVLNMTVDSGIAADRDFHLNVDGAKGDDFINFAYTGPITPNQIADMAALRVVTLADNITKLRVHGSVDLNGGAGNDTIKFWGDGAVNANGGDGNDVIFVGQNPDEVAEVLPQETHDDNAVFIFNAGTTNAAGYVAPAALGPEKAIYFDPIGGAQSLDNDALGTTDRFGYTATAVGTDVTVRVSFKGFASKAITLFTPNASNLTGNLSADDINKGIIKAINDDPVLGKLLVAKDGAGHSLLVESLFDDLMAATDLVVSFGGIVGALGNNGAAAYATRFATDLTLGAEVMGDDTGTVSINRVNGGAGDDVVVLNTSATKAAPNPGFTTVFDTLVVDGSIGNDHVVNFNAATDRIDLTALGATKAVLAAAVPLANNTFTVVELLPAINGSAFNAANAKGGGFIQHGATDKYTFFKVENDATPGVVASEVTILGTMTFDADTAVLGAINLA